MTIQSEQDARQAARWTKKNAEEEGRRITGMGFFRLVWIVAFGILIAQAIGRIALWVIRSLGAP